MLLFLFFSSPFQMCVWRQILYNCCASQKFNTLNSTIKVVWERDRQKQTFKNIRSSYWMREIYYITKLIYFHIFSSAKSQTITQCEQKVFWIEIIVNINTRRQQRKKGKFLQIWLVIAPHWNIFQRFTINILRKS